MEKLAVVFSALASAKFTALGPLVLLHSVVTEAGGSGRLSSVTVPLRVALFGKEIVWLGPASTVGGWLRLTVMVISS